MFVKNKKLSSLLVVRYYNPDPKEKLFYGFASKRIKFGSSGSWVLFRLMVISIDKIFWLLGLCFTIFTVYYAKRRNKTGLWTQDSSLFSCGIDEEVIPMSFFNKKVRIFLMSLLYTISLFKTPWERSMCVFSGVRFSRS